MKKYFKNKKINYWCLKYAFNSGSYLKHQKVINSHNNLKDYPLVSIILPIDNNGSYINDCLKSLFSQTYENIEVIAVDDFSKDNSLKLLKKFKKCEKRLRVYKNVKKYGLEVTLNRALRRAKGMFVALMNPYDISSPYRIKKQVNYLLSNPKTVVVGTQCVFINQKNKLLKKSIFPKENSEIYKTFLQGSSFLFETAMINKNLLPRDILKFSKNLYSLIYVDFFTKILPFGEIINLPQYLYRKRQNINLGEDSSIKLSNIFLTVKLWLKSIALYDYRPSLRSIFNPLINAR